jgi:molybdopterin converting factor small subunit
MPLVRLPSLLQAMAGGATAVQTEGATLRSVIDDLERRHPGLRDRIIEGDEIRADVMIAVNADEVRDLDAPVPADGEVHILPAIAGGCH